jgi:hypothetical protein
MNPPPAPNSFGTWAVLAVLLGLLGLAVWFGVKGWGTDDGPAPPISTMGYVAMGLGIVATLALGIGLMALIFYDNRRD